MKICLYGHAGSDNHGCEAIVRSTNEVLQEIEPIIKLYSRNKDADIKYDINSIIPEIIKYHRFFKENTIPYLINFILRYGFKNNMYFYIYANNKLLENIDSNSIYFSIGGDNYCYGDSPTNLAYINKKISCKTKTVLWGASIEKEIINKPSVIKDLNRYSLITARESLTYNSLLEAGINKNTHLIPDTAFILPSIEKELPKGFIEGKTIGINVSPLVQQLENQSDLVYSNYKELIKYIITETNNNVALIPHVVIEGKNDLEPLKRLFNEFKNTNRIILIEDHNCMELKGYIARCSIFVGARTHATIAAYSSYLPTLVLGYSVKSKGIAKDIFGTYENYVIPVEELKCSNDLLDSFKWVMENSDDIRTYLKVKIPEYIKPIKNLAKIVSELT